MKLLSIIVPVYNLEKYIVKCLDSIYNQGVDEELFEVLTIDDGSRDGSLSLLNNYAIIHSNMNVLSQNNSGVSVARNKGIQKCTGKYVTFIDGDDLMAEGAFPLLIKLLKEDKRSYDVCYCRTFMINNTGSKIETHLWQKNFNGREIYNGENIIKASYLNGGSVCGGVYRKEFLLKNDMFFAEGIANGEDTIFNYILYAKNPCIIFADIPLNIFCVREGSASHSQSIERVERFRKSIQALDLLSEKEKKTESVKQAIDASYYHIISMAVNMYIKLGGRDVCYIRDVLNIKKMHKLHCPWLPWHQRLKVAMINISFSLYFKILVFRYSF